MCSLWRSSRRWSCFVWVPMTESIAAQSFRRSAGVGLVRGKTLSLACSSVHPRRRSTVMGMTTSPYLLGMCVPRSTSAFAHMRFASQVMLSVSSAQRLLPSH